MMTKKIKTRRTIEFWSNIENQRRFLERLGVKLGFKSNKELISLDHHTISDHQGGPLCHFYKHNTKVLLATAFPEIYWDFLKPQERGGVWYDINNQRACLERIAALKDFKTLDDWYSVPSTEIIENYNCHFIKSQYGGSLPKCLANVFPNHKWKLWKFTQIPKSYWNDMKEQRKFFNDFAEENQIKSFDQWYGISSDQVEKYGGGNLLRAYYGGIVKNMHVSRIGSLASALMTAFPHHPWEIWRFERVPNGFWEIKENRRKFFDQIFQHLELERWEDWYTVKSETLNYYGASYLLNQYYDNSLVKAVKDVYPEYPFKTWLFTRIPDKFWDETSNQIDFVKWVEEKLQIKNPEDWFRVSVNEVTDLGGKRLMEKYGGITSLLYHLYPNIDWMNGFKQYNSVKSQHFLFKVLIEAFPNVTDIQMGYRHPNLIFKNSQTTMELDIYIPELNLAFEYQGKQHYEEIASMNTEGRQDRDQEKRIACKNLGLTLIEVPYWWDRTKESLLATIHNVRPDIVKEPGTGKVIELLPIKR